MTTPIPDDMTELLDADFPRVDLVGKGANGIPRFLIAKQASGSGLLDPGYVRDLIGKETAPAPGPAPAESGEVSMTGSPAAIAKFIHEAAVRRDAGATADPGTEPKEAGMASDPVSKDMGPDLDESSDGMDPTVPLATPDGDAPGDPTDPGSPAWEAIDAATAQKWTSILARARVAVDLLSEREMLEAAAADPGDIDNAFDLQDVCSAIDYAISVLAPFAVSEQSEADCGADAMAAIGKAAAGLPGPLQTVEALAAITKGGRVLSASNESAIREAVASLQKVLANLPQTTDSGQPVAKQHEEATMATTATGPEGAAAGDPVAKTATPADPAGVTPGESEAAADVAKTAGPGSDPAPAGPAPANEPVTKAGKVPQVAVYDAKGKLVGIVESDAITPIAGVDAPDDDPEDGAGDAPDPAAPDLTAAPASQTGTPAAAVNGDGTVTKNAQDDTITVTRTELESIVTKAVTAANGTQEPAQDVAKQADVAALQGQVETLTAQLAKVAEQPAAPKVFTNGQIPPAHHLRGQDQGTGAPHIDVAKNLERKREMYTADAPEAAEIAKGLNAEAIVAISAIHAGQPVPPQPAH